MLGLEQIGKFSREHPFLAILFGASSIYVASENLRAVTAPKGEYWNRGLWGIGGTSSTTSSSSAHGPFQRSAEMAKEPSPEDLFGTTSTSTTTSSSHSTGMMRGDQENIGEPSMPMPMMLHGIQGVPSSVKRRVVHGKLNQDLLPASYGMPAIYETPKPSSPTVAEDLFALQGVMPPSGGEGWL